MVDGGGEIKRFMSGRRGSGRITCLADERRPRSRLMKYGNGKRIVPNVTRFLKPQDCPAAGIPIVKFCNYSTDTDFVGELGRSVT